MTFQDIFKSDFLDNITGVSLLDMTIALVLAFALGLFIFLIYKHTYKGVMYSSSFGLSLIALTMITSLVILAISSNIILSLGMVGALSIVRFRAAIKDPVDIVYLFWSIAVGIVLAAGLIPLAVFGSILIGLVLLIFSNRKQKDIPYILLVECDNKETEEIIKKIIKNDTMKMILKSKKVTELGIELNYEVRLKGDDTEFIQSLSDTDGVKNTVLVSYNGDYGI